MDQFCAAACNWILDNHVNGRQNFNANVSFKKGIRINQATVGVRIKYQF